MNLFGWLKWHRAPHPVLTEVLWAIQEELGHGRVRVEKVLMATQESLNSVVLALREANRLKELELRGEVWRLRGAEGDKSALIAHSEEEMAKIEAAMTAYRQSGAPPVPPEELEIEDWTGA